MAIHDMTNTRVGQRAANVVLQVTVDGRNRTVLIDPEAAIQIANQIATSAVQLLGRGAPADIGVDSIRLRPFDERAQAHLALGTEHGPFVFRLDAKELEALAASAQGALELGQVGGKA